MNIQQIQTQVQNPTSIKTIITAEMRVFTNITAEEANKCYSIMLNHIGDLCREYDLLTANHNPDREGY